MTSEGIPRALEVTVFDESAEEASARKRRFAQAKAIHGPSNPPPEPRLQTPDSRGWMAGPKPIRRSLVLRAAGVDELLLNRVDRVRFYSLGAALLINGVLTGLLATYALTVLLPTIPGVIGGVVGALCGLLNFFIDRSTVNTIIVRHLDDRHDRGRLALSLSGRILLAFLAAMPTAYVLAVQIYALQLRELADSLPPSSTDALKATADLSGTWSLAAIQVLFTGMLVTLQLVPAIMAAFARTSLYARVLRATENGGGRPVEPTRTDGRRRTGRGISPQHRRTAR